MYGNGQKSGEVHRHAVYLYNLILLYNEDSNRFYLYLGKALEEGVLRRQLSGQFTK